VGYAITTPERIEFEAICTTDCEIDASERGHPMSLFSFAVISTCGIAPAVAGECSSLFHESNLLWYQGVIEQYLGWRWIQWIGMIFSGVFFIWLVVHGAPETRGRAIQFHENMFSKLRYLWCRNHPTCSEGQETEESYWGFAISHCC
jgi:MFS family permease